MSVGCEDYMSTRANTQTQTHTHTHTQEHDCLLMHRVPIHLCLERRAARFKLSDSFWFSSETVYMTLFLDWFINSASEMKALDMEMEMDENKYLTKMDY